MNHIEAAIARIRKKKERMQRRSRLFTSGRSWQEYGHLHRMMQARLPAS